MHDPLIHSGGKIHERAVYQFETWPPSAIHKITGIHIFDPDQDQDQIETKSDLIGIGQKRPQMAFARMSLDRFGQGKNPT
jgi:hypothetical protein